MIGRIKSWFTPPPPETRGYVDAILSAQLAAASGTGSIRDSAVYQACKHLIADCVSTATLEGDGADVLQPRLGEIASAMVDTGQAAFELIAGRSGRAWNAARRDHQRHRAGRGRELGLHRGAGRSDGYHDRHPGASGRPQLPTSTFTKITLEGNAESAGGEHNLRTTSEVGDSDDCRSGL